MTSVPQLRSIAPKQLQALAPRQLQLAGAGCIALLFVALAVYLVLPQWRVASSADASLQLLRSSVQDGANLDDKLNTLHVEVDQLERTLNGDASNLPAKQMEAFVIGRLQTISWRNDVILVSVTPRDGTPLNQFRELIFDVELQAGYFDFFDWLRDINDELGFVVVKRFEMSPANRRTGDNDSGLQVKLTMAAYRKRD